MEVLGSGIIQYVSSEFIIVSRAHNLYYSVNSGKEWELWCSLPVPMLDKFFSSNRCLSRLSRKEVHHIQKVSNQLYVCFAFNSIYLIEETSGKIEKIGAIKGSRPLKICTDGQYIYYGVYKKNKDRNPIELLSYNLQNKVWSVVYTFKDIRHIHGTFWDSNRSKLWVTTGDLDKESSIICFNNSIPQKILTGSQQARAVDLLFSEHSIFYGTDIPHKRNFIYRLDRQSRKNYKLQEVGGPIFWGRKEKNWLFFATVVEPSEVNRMDAVEIWCSVNNGKDWEKIIEFKKDRWPLKLFQYGQVKLPSGCGDERYFWFTPYATMYDHKIIRISYNQLNHSH